MTHSTEFASFATARANLCRFFASLFLAPPTEELLESVRTDDFRSALAAWAEGVTRESLDGVELEALVLEYNRLFVVPGSRYVAPFESVYTDQVDVEYTPHMISGAGEMPTRVKSLLWGPSTVAVERAYAIAGFGVRDGAEPPDHVGIELQFLARLCDEQVRAWTEDDEQQAAQLEKLEADFLQAHPLRWITSWRGRLEAAGAHPFYRAMARATESMLRSSLRMVLDGEV